MSREGHAESGDAAYPRTPAAGPPDSAAGFGDWVRPHWNAMYRLARRLAGDDAGDDVLQEALAAAWRKRRQFDPERGSAQAWLLAIVADQAYKNRRRLRPTVELVSDVPGPTDADWPPGVDIAGAIRRLSRRQQLAVTLHYYLGMPVTETAEVMACSPGTVKSTLSDARARLRTLLGDDYR